MYCSIQEAWPDYKNTRSFNTNATIERFNQNDVKENRPEISHIIKSEPETSDKVIAPQIKKITCNDILSHVEICHECKEYLSSKYKQNKFVDLLIASPQLKETITIFLIGIVILMVLNLFYK